MPSLSRFGVSIETPLLRRFDRMIAAGGYQNRSEAIRDMIRSRLVEQIALASGTRAFGILSLVYDHSRRELEAKLTDLQHHHHHVIIASTHVHIDHDNCLEVILLKGTVGEIRTIAAGLTSLKGVDHSNLVFTSPLGSRT